jgi:hypothetical protein
MNSSCHKSLAYIHRSGTRHTLAISMRSTDSMQITYRSLTQVINRTHTLRDKVTSRPTGTRCASAPATNGADWTDTPGAVAVAVAAAAADGSAWADAWPGWWPRSRAWPLAAVARGTRGSCSPCRGAGAGAGAGVGAAAAAGVDDARRTAARRSARPPEAATCGESAAAWTRSWAGC